VSAVAGEGRALAPETVRDLWAHARELALQAERESDHPALRRALVTCAVAGSGGDPEAFRALLADVHRAAKRLAFADPQPLFDAAAALVAQDDLPAREAIVLAPSRDVPPPRPPLSGTMYDELRSRD
jgi:hypothetical protein